LNCRYRGSIFILIFVRVIELTPLPQRQNRSVIGWLQKLSALLGIGIALGLAGPVARAAPTPKPNIIFILIDDMGYGDLSCYGGPSEQTPNIDSLAQAGIRFTQFYVGAPICSPSRTTFTTGQFPARWRVTSFLASRAENERRGMAQWLDVSAPTLARTLQQAGYVTGHFGKWHLGGQRDVGEAPLISEYGFNETLTQFEGLGDRILPLLDAFDGQPAQKYALGSDNLGRGNIEWLDRSKVTAAFVKRSLDFIQRAEQAGKPFYLNLWPDDVHSPFFPPKELRGDTTKRELYLGVVKAMDAQFAALFDYVRHSPSLRTNTIIVLASDNGPEPGAGSAGPFRGHKGMLYEGGIREPFIVWGPGFMPKSAHGSLNETTVVSALDLFPSLARLTGVRVPTAVKLDGEDLSEALLGKNKSHRSKQLFWNRPPDRSGNNRETWPDLATREGNWKLLMMRDGSEPQLYDLQHDPGETQNLAGKHPKVVKRMSQTLLTWWESLPASRESAELLPKQAGSGRRRLTNANSSGNE
jgi:arylsulfatase A-like enzyme